LPIQRDIPQFDLAEKRGRERKEKARLYGAGPGFSALLAGRPSDRLPGGDISRAAGIAADGSDMKNAEAVGGTLPVSVATRR
jgi:hypothetical protein